MAWLEEPRGTQVLRGIVFLTSLSLLAFYWPNESFSGFSMRKNRRLKEEHSRTDELLDLEPRPRIYIYDLPPNATACVADCVEYDTESLYSSTVVIAELLRNSSHLTSDPERADLFYIPSPVGHITMEVRGPLDAGLRFTLLIIEPPCVHTGDGMSVYRSSTRQTIRHRLAAFQSRAPEIATPTDVTQHRAYSCKLAAASLDASTAGY
jgi:hypothetical protein